MYLILSACHLFRLCGYFVFMASLILLRHGQSTWNFEERFTGWVDVDLTDKGVEEAYQAGRRLKDENITIDVVHTSLLLRAIRTTDAALYAHGSSWVPIHKHWRLNERHYGALQGHTRAEMAQMHSPDQVKLWRRSYDVRPPELDLDDERHPRFDPRYRSLDPAVLPSSECLKDVLERMLPYFFDSIIPDLMAQRNVLVSAHGNSLRAMIKHLENIGDREILSLEIPNGVPIIYQLDSSFKAVKTHRLD